VVTLAAALYGPCDAKRWRTVTVGLFEIGNVWFWGSGCYRCDCANAMSLVTGCHRSDGVSVTNLLDDLMEYENSRLGGGEKERLSV
jgi:hypothetical protein